MSLPIRARLTAWYVALLAVILLALCAFLVVRLRADLLRSTDQELAVRAAQISVGLRAGCEGEFRDLSGSTLRGLPNGESGAQLLGPAGQVLESSGDPIAQAPLLAGSAFFDAFRGVDVEQTISSGPDREPFRVLGVRAASDCSGVIVVVTSLDDLNRSVHRLITLLLLAGPAVVLLAGAGGWFLAGRALRPVARMTREAAAIGEEALDSRVDVPETSDELHRLAETLNAMLDRVQRGVDQKRRFVADASHELRTPLAVMRTELDVRLLAPDIDPGSREALASAREEVEQMATIVENLLTLARLDEGGVVTVSGAIDLRAIASESVAALRSVLEAKPVEAVVDGAVALAKGDPTSLRQVLTNLVANAVKFSAPGGHVEVSTWAGNGTVGVRVTDHGAGIDASLQPHIFERFVRADPARSSEGGSGLGLAICREIIVAHGGRIWVESRKGEGSTFTFELPSWDPT
ncbi:MAG: hypothetical protein QOE83_1904 [Actinomycetota bacterium]|jgi:heavy metal sensor kinase|nr:hypothetical protein [Actinomycetota bacterium]